jgi:hypothetical protein
MTFRHCLILAAVALSLALGTALPARAKIHVAALGLNATATTCDTARKGTYTYTARWSASAAKTGYTVHTGNQCKVGAQVCGIAQSTGCAATCDALGRCTATLTACIATAAAAGQWVKVFGTDGGWQQITAAPPSKCQ